MKKASERINNIINNNHKNNFENVRNLIKNDIYFLLTNYFDVEFDDIDIGFRQSKDGDYIFCMTSKTNDIKMPKFFN